MFCDSYGYLLSNCAIGGWADLASAYGAAVAVAVAFGVFVGVARN